MPANRTCLSYWFPLLANSGIQLPRTEIIRTDVELIRLWDGETPDGFAQFLADLTAAAQRIGTPCFLRTGLTSNKHNWKETCYLTQLIELPNHVARLVEFSEIADLMGLATDVWVVRELLPTEPAFTAFRGAMPITKERRYFVSNGRVVCRHPYWPPESIGDEEAEPDVGNDEWFAEPLCHTTDPNWRTKLAEINRETDEEVAILTRLSEIAGLHVPGDWSIDWLWTKNGWYLTDMAEAARSYHWAGCEASGVFAR